MRKLKVIDLTGASWQQQAVGMLRPSVEAALLAGVALGCAQIGWEALTASSADASSSSPLERNESPEAEIVEVRSPFAPNGAEESHASATLVANVGLAGIRMSENAALSGAILTLEGGVQRAFIVGQQVAEGVTLGAVMPDKVVLSYEGGSKELSLAPASTVSYAMALMGRTSIDPIAVAAVEPAPVLASAIEPEALGVLGSAAVAVSPSQVSEAVGPAGAGATQSDVEWLAATMSQVEQAESGMSGWRVGGEPPTMVADAGLLQGDLILSINGAGPEAGVDLLSAIGSGPIEVAVERDGKRVDLSIAAFGRS